jgi:hypothetical protein
MSKVDISMTAVEVDAFLARCPQMVVGALDHDGWPVGTLAASTYVDGMLSLRFPGEDAMFGDICCVWDEHVAYFEIQGVIVHGRATPHADAPGHATVDIERLISFDFARIPRA